MSEAIDNELQAKFANDPHRPRYHFMPPANWMNDPNGLIQWRGEYHLFYQHNPEAPGFGRMIWGHALSRDLVHWEHLPHALPTGESYDKDGVWSGSAIDNNGELTLMYTGVNPQTQCIATSKDGRTFTKHPANPVIPGPPEGLQVTGFRDPCLWRDGDTFCTLIGSGVAGEGGKALLYRSKDLQSWDYVGPILTGDHHKTGQMWECPDLFAQNGRHALLVSVNGTTLYFTGSYAGDEFTEEFQGNTDFGGCFYAAQTFRDDNGRQIMFGWVWEKNSEQARMAAGWAGVMSLPRVLNIRDDYRLGMQPAPELQALRQDHHHFDDLTIHSNSANLLKDIKGDCLEIMAEFEMSEATSFGIKVRCSPREAEETLISYDRNAHSLTVDTSRSSRGAHSDDDALQVRHAPLLLETHETLKLHIFLDRSVLEVFANGHTCMTTRIYPKLNSQGVDLFARAGNAQLKSLDIWTMKAIW